MPRDYRNPSRISRSASAALALLRYTAVNDHGVVINPMLLEGQAHGGIAQGLGQALLERTVYDPDSGQLVSGSFMDYAMPRATGAGCKLKRRAVCRTDDRER